ncbi:DUF6234 family protein [Luedemannella flava]
MGFRDRPRGWANSYDDDPGRSHELSLEAARAWLWLSSVLAAGPVVLAGLALAGRLRGTFLTFVALAVLLVPVGTIGAAQSWRTLHPAPPPPAGPTHCVEFSGGDTRCPGG